MVCSEILPEALSTCSERFSVWERASMKLQIFVSTRLSSRAMSRSEAERMLAGAPFPRRFRFPSEELFAFPVEIVAFVTAEGDDLLREQDERDGDGPFLHPCFAGRDAEEHIVVP